MSDEAVVRIVMVNAGATTSGTSANTTSSTAAGIAGGGQWTDRLYREMSKSVTGINTGFKDSLFTVSSKLDNIYNALNKDNQEYDKEYKEFTVQTSLLRSIDIGVNKTKAADVSIKPSDRKIVEAIDKVTSNIKQLNINLNPERQKADEGNSKIKSIVIGALTTLGLAKLPVIIDVFQSWFTGGLLKKGVVGAVEGGATAVDYATSNVPGAIENASSFIGDNIGMIAPLVIGGVVGLISAYISKDKEKEKEKSVNELLADISKNTKTGKSEDLLRDIANNTKALNPPVKVIEENTTSIKSNSSTIGVMLIEKLQRIVELMGGYRDPLESQMPPLSDGNPMRGMGRTLKEEEPTGYDALNKAVNYPTLPKATPVYPEAIPMGPAPEPIPIPVPEPALGPLTEEEIVAGWEEDLRATEGAGLPDTRVDFPEAEPIPDLPDTRIDVPPPKPVPEPEPVPTPDPTPELEPIPAPELENFLEPIPESTPAPESEEEEYTGHWSHNRKFKQILIDMGIRKPPHWRRITLEERDVYRIAKKELGEAPLFARGGSVDHPGRPQGTDTVPAWLTKGEYVVNAKDAAENKEVLDDINSGKGVDTGEDISGNVEYHSIGGMAKGGLKMAGGALSSLWEVRKQATVIGTTASADTSKTISQVGDAFNAVGGQLATVHPLLGAMAQGIGGAIKGFSELTAAINQTVDRYGEYSPEIAQAQAMAEVTQTLGDMARAQESGGELAQFVMQQSELQQQFENTKIKILMQIVPTVTSVLELMSNIMGSGEGIEAAIAALFSPINGISSAINDMVKLGEESRVSKIQDPTDLILKNWDKGWTPKDD